MTNIKGLEAIRPSGGATYEATLIGRNVSNGNFLIALAFAGPSGLARVEIFRATEPELQLRHFIAVRPQFPPLVLGRQSQA